MDRSARRLVVVSATSLTGRKNLDWLYRFVDTAGPAVVAHLLGPSYAAITEVHGPDATAAAIVDALRAAATRPGTQAVDLVFMVHGLDGKVVLSDGAGRIDRVRMTDLATAIAAAVPAGQLRLCYSTACYGATHNDAWLAAGFRAAIGARAVNANSATELPTLLSLWGDGKPLKDALARGEEFITRMAADELARRFGKFRDVNSDKILAGDGTLTIDA